MGRRRLLKTVSEYDKQRVILMVDDDAEDCQLVRDALLECGQTHDLRVVRDGEELFEYLQRRGQYEGGREAPLPDLILMDLKMPRKDGRETLREMKADRRLRRIPIVALTTSNTQDDIAFTYDMGVNSYIAKPSTFRKWVQIIKILTDYWFETVELPPASLPERKINIR
jgi:two-component system, response regulator